MRRIGVIYIFDESYYNGGVGEIKYGVIGGTEPYQETIIGTAEYLRSDGDLEMIEDVNSSIDGNLFPISTNNIEVPTIPWIDELADEYGYVYKKQPYNIFISDAKGAVPYMSIKDMFECGEQENTTQPQPTPPVENEGSGIELVNIINNI